MQCKLACNPTPLLTAFFRFLEEHDVTVAEAACIQPSYTYSFTCQVCHVESTRRGFSSSRKPLCTLCELEGELETARASLEPKRQMALAAESADLAAAVAAGVRIDQLVAQRCAQCTAVIDAAVSSLTPHPSVEIGDAVMALLQSQAVLVARACQVCEPAALATVKPLQLWRLKSAVEALIHCVQNLVVTANMFAGDSSTAACEMAAACKWLTASNARLRASLIGDGDLRFCGTVWHDVERAAHQLLSFASRMAQVDAQEVACFGND